MQKRENERREKKHRKIQLINSLVKSCNIILVIIRRREWDKWYTFHCWKEQTIEKEKIQKNSINCLICEKNLNNYSPWNIKYRRLLSKAENVQENWTNQLKVRSVTRLIISRVEAQSIREIFDCSSLDHREPRHIRRTLCPPSQPRWLRSRDNFDGAVIRKYSGRMRNVSVLSRGGESRPRQKRNETRNPLRGYTRCRSKQSG